METIIKHKLRVIILDCFLLLGLSCSSASAAFVDDDYLGSIHGLTNGLLKYTGSYTNTNAGVLWGSVENGLLYNQGYFYIVKNRTKYIADSLEQGGEVDSKDIYRVFTDKNATLYVVTTSTSDKRSGLNLEVVGVNGKKIYRYVDSDSFYKFIINKYKDQVDFEELAYGRIIGVWADGQKIKLQYQTSNGFSDYVYLLWDYDLDKFVYFANIICEG